jgi:hypothetical protein
MADRVNIRYRVRYNKLILSYLNYRELFLTIVVIQGVSRKMPNVLIIKQISKNSVSGVSLFHETL